MSKSVGILGFQGCIEPHEAMLNRLGVKHLRVLNSEDFKKCDRIILPGGESTTMLKFLDTAGLFNELKEFVTKHPTWGICAGSILLAKEVSHPTQRSLGAINIKAYRNYYGSQIDSFTKDIDIKDIANNLPVHFIRAPRLERLNDDPKVVELSKIDETCIFFREKNIWATAFHVELGDDTRLHKKFIEL